MILAHVRVLLPFRIVSACSTGGDALVAVRSALNGLTVDGKAVWEPAEPRALYQRAIHPFAIDAVFDPEGHASGKWRYAQLTETGFGRVFKTPQVRGLVLGPNEEPCALQPVKDPGVELFLSEFGFGVLSLPFALMPDKGDSDRGDSRPLLTSRDTAAEAGLRASLGDRFARLLSAVHALSRMGNDATAPRFAPAKEPYKGQAKPAADSPLIERMSQVHGRFRMEELFDWLLPFDWSPLGVSRVSTAGGDRAYRGQLCCYSTVRLPRPPDGDGYDPDCLHALTWALSQAEPPSSSMPGERLAYELRPVHFARASTLGAAHVLISQHDPPTNYDTERPERVKLQYFLPYLLALHERWHGLMTSADCARLMRTLIALPSDLSATDDSSFRQITALNGRMLEFAQAAAFESVSTYSYVEKWYELSRIGLGADRQLAAASTALDRLARSLATLRTSQDILATKAAAEETRKVQEKIERAASTTAAIQGKVEWVEVILLVTYYVKLIDIVSKQAHVPAAAGTLAVGVGALLGTVSALLLISPWKPDHREHSTRNRVVLLAGLGLALFLYWLWAWSGVDSWQAAIPGSPTESTPH